MSDSFSERVRAAVEEQRARDAELDSKPSEFQETAADDLSRLLGEEIDPLAVTMRGADGAYNYAVYSAYGLMFVGKFGWGGGDRRYYHVGMWEATRHIHRRLRPTRVETRLVTSLADLDGWV